MLADDEVDITIGPNEVVKSVVADCKSLVIELPMR